MKLRFTRDAGVDVQKKSDDELWWKQYRRWDEVQAETIIPLPDGKTVNVITYDGDVILFLPKDSFEICQ